MNLTQNFTLSEMTKSRRLCALAWQMTPAKPRLKTFVSCAKTFSKVRNYYGMGVKVN
jgi:hypothetical protein